MDTMLSTSAYSYSNSLTGSVMHQFEHPTMRLLQESGFRQISYLAWKKACLEERSAEGERRLPVSSSLTTCCSRENSCEQDNRIWCGWV